MNEQEIKKQFSRKIRGKKRLAICGGSIGRENRILIQGQVVDAGIREPFNVDSLLDFLTGLFNGEEDFITPFLDFSLAPVRKPFLKIQILRETELIYESDIFSGSRDGFFNFDSQLKLEPGLYFYQVVFQGSDSYRQQTRDLNFITNFRESRINNYTVIGMGRLTVLPSDYTGYITTSDIDQTYLATDLETKGGKLATLFETPEQKLPIPGMPELYKEMKLHTNNSPLSFISASPHFFRRSLAATIRKDGIEMDSLNLKYLNGTLQNVMDKAINSIFNLDDLFRDGFAPALNRMKKFWNSSYLSLFDQLTYKLSTLLHNRLYQPTRAKEILMGDNTESDYLIFTLYQLILMDLISGKELEDYLYNLHFLGRNAVTRDNAIKIKKLASECLAIHGKMNPVEVVLINMSHMGPVTEEMTDHLDKALPIGINIHHLENFKLYHTTEGALGFAVILHAKNIIPFESMINVATSMLGKWFNGQVIDEKYLLSLCRNLSVPDYAEGTKHLLRDVVETALQS
ncbi:MAG: hypothetical protein H7A25_09385 [Leptospiraceae bacterium]|nr:hypothetical protein [Leptospiraceae bacterium]MCP5500102.1 hypothetical protein [Leptospiraceae bacterium]